LAYKAEHVVDLQTDLVLAAEVYHADQSDSQTLVDSVVAAQTHLNEATLAANIEEVAADKGYHAAETLELAQSLGLRTYVAEPKRPRRLRWHDKRAELQQAVYANRRRAGRSKAKRLQRKRSELIERTFAHTCETGGGRRSWLRGIEKVRKRWTIQAAARNLGLILRTVFGIGTARSLQDLQNLLSALYLALILVERSLQSLVQVERFQSATPSRQRCCR
ncbi:transposase, partial [Bremerella cremea]|uniref:transposase n=1 Tax=Bremerella cremea TaxID=1031537 RepID=UPI001F177334